MKNRLTTPRVLAVVATALLAGCGGPFALRQAQGDIAQGDTARSAQGDNALAQVDGGRGGVALTMPHYVQRPVHTDRNGSSLSPDAKKIKALLYVGDWSTNDVFVYNYQSGAPVGTITGNDEPYGMCVDAKGDVYVANFGSGTVNEYAHGGTLIQTYSPGGEPIGCAVDAKGDLAATSFSPGEVTVYAKGNPNKGTTYSNSSCEYLWTMGYDKKGDLLGGGEYSSIVFCAVLAGSKTMITLQTGSGFPQVNFPGGVTWDGKYYAIGAQEMGGKYQAGIIRAILKGLTLTYVGETSFSDDCYSDYVDDVNPFIVGKTNSLFNGKQGNAMAGPNLWCVDAGAAKVDYWHYPAGGMPYKTLGSPPAEPYGVGVSIAQ